MRQHARPHVVRLVVGQQSLLRRLAGRQICSACRAVYSTHMCPSRIPGKCDVDGSSLITREDDREETILERLRIYEGQISAIVDHYSKYGVVLEIDGDRTVEEVTTEILRAIREPWRTVVSRPALLF
jgi:adenylate kinase